MSILHPQRSQRKKTRRFPSGASSWVWGGVPVPSSLWGFQDAASPVVDSIAAKNLVQNQAVLYRQAGDPLRQYRVEADTSNVNEFLAPADATWGDIGVGESMSIFVRFRQPDNAAITKALFGKGVSTAIGTAHWAVNVTATTGVIGARLGDTVERISKTLPTAWDDGNTHDLLYVVDVPNALLRIHVDGESDSVALTAGILNSINTVGIAPGSSLHFGGAVAQAATVGLAFSYACYWKNKAITAGQFRTMRGAV